MLQKGIQTRKFENLKSIPGIGLKQLASKETSGIEK